MKESNKDSRFHFVYEQDGQDKQLWVNATGWARAYDEFWSLLDGEDINKIEVERYNLEPVEGLEGVSEWIPSGII